MLRVRSLLARAGLALALVASAAAAIELGARFAYCALAERRLSLSPGDFRSLFVRDPDLLYRARAGFDGAWGRAHPVPVRINAGGLRGAERSLERPKGTLRVLCVGDSRTWGFDVREDDAYPRALERLLNSRGASQTVEAINAATPGYTSYQGLMWLQRNLRRYQPDVVTACFGFNDRLLAGEKSGDLSMVRQTPESFRAAWAWRWTEASFAVRTLRSWTARAWSGSDASRLARARERKAELLERWETLEGEVTPDEYEEHLEEIAELCRVQQAELAIVALPDNPELTAPLDSAAARLGDRDLAGAWRALMEYATPPDSTLPWAFTDYDLLANALARRVRRGAPDLWLHKRVPANLALSTAAAYNDIARRVAEHTGAVFVDATGALSAMPGVYFDECHFDSAGHARVAELLAPAVLGAVGGE